MLQTYALSVIIIKHTVEYNPGEEPDSIKYDMKAVKYPFFDGQIFESVMKLVTKFQVCATKTLQCHPKELLMLFNTRNIFMGEGNSPICYKCKR